MAFMSEEEKRRRERLDLIKAKMGIEGEKSILDAELPIGSKGEEGSSGIGRFFRLFKKKKRRHEDEDEESNDDISRKERQADESLW